MTAKGVRDGAGLATALVYTQLLSDAIKAKKRYGTIPARLDTTFPWDEAAARALFAQLGQSVPDDYDVFYLSPTRDLGLPFCYAVCFAAWFVVRGQHARALLPLIGGVADLTENFSIFSLRKAYPDFSGPRAELALAVGPVATAIKWVCFLLSILLLTFGGRKSTPAAAKKKDA
ncbi:hypothetical protein AB1Y20_011970 [Prymnesium parvum]|uniref:Uncharacterized protein n=1 Tax=Prymnesium parvum TaxID=97485 RepID=A0AB34IPJ0_PRYPA|mmetsp:Transcript_8892/g.21992  ORF Transcript_8892/g.21992 Transcript_8892/m.21992 type:complete len:174 (-) Transcript_8892:202-723(-)